MLASSVTMAPRRWESALIVASAEGKTGVNTPVFIPQ